MKRSGNGIKQTCKLFPVCREQFISLKLKIYKWLKFSGLCLIDQENHYRYNDDFSPVWCADEPVQIFFFPPRRPPVKDISEEHHGKDQLISNKCLGNNRQVHAVRQLVKHGIYPFHIISPEPYTCKGYEIEGDEYFPDMNKDPFFVLIWTDLFPELINNHSYTVQSSPDDKLEI